VISSLTANALCRPQNTLTILGGRERKCLTRSRFVAKMPIVAMRIMPPEPPP
jgi:hypothetical protein